MIDGSVAQLHYIKMVNKVIKPKNCKESLSKKKEISHRKSSCSTKKVKINLQVDVSANSDVAVSVKFRNNTKMTTWSEAAFDCPNPDCDLTVKRYRNLFNHFADKCRWSGFEDFEWWCSTCKIPRYWVGGSDLVRHMQTYHGLSEGNWPKDGSFPERFLSFRWVVSRKVFVIQMCNGRF